MWLTSMRVARGSLFFPRLTFRDCEPNVCHKPMPCTAVRWQAEALPVGVVSGQNRVWAARQQQGLDLLLVGIR